MKDLLELVEHASGKDAGSTKKLGMWNPKLLLNEFFFGQTIHHNMECMLAYFDENSAEEKPVQGDDFWAAFDSQPKVSAS